MVKQNAVAREHAICIPIFFDHPEAVLFSYRIRTERVKRSILILRHFFDLAIELRSRSLIYFAGLIKAEHMNRLKYAQNT